MSKLNDNDLQSNIASNVYENTNQEVTGQHLQNVLTNVNDSKVSRTDDITQDIETNKTSTTLLASVKQIYDWVTSKIANFVSNTRTISTTAPLSGGGDLSTDRTLSITQATTSTNGYLSSTDWNTFNNKVSTSRTLMIQGNNQDLSTNRTFNITESIIIACSDETTALTTGTAKVTFRMPYAFTLTDVRASLTTAGGTSGTTTINVKESGTTIFSTKVTIDFGAKTSTTASTQRVISDSNLADDAEITIDIDAVTGAGTEKGLKVYLIGYKS